MRKAFSGDTGKEMDLDMGKLTCRSGLTEREGSSSLCAGMK
jgi:hypothetical protein